MTATSSFLVGCSAALEFVAGLFFLRFGRQLRDRLFLRFGLAFLLFTLSRALQVFFSAGDEVALVYLPRLAGFVLIAVAIVGKNRTA